MLDIITPDLSVPPRAMVSADTPGADGRLTVLPGHAPLVCSLSPGQTRLRLEDGARETWATGAGTLTVARDSVTLLVQSASKTS